MPDLLLVVPADPPNRLDKALAEAAPAEAGISRTQLARLIAEGAVIGPAGPATDAKARPVPGTEYRVTLGPVPDSTPQPEAIALDIVHEDEWLIVIDKPAGMVIHPAPGTPSGTLVNALLAHCGGVLSDVGDAARPGIVHRLDKDTSGLLVAAKTARAYDGLAAQFAARTVERRYLALAHGNPDAGDPRLAGVPGLSFEAGGVLRIDAPLGRHPTNRQRQAVRPTQGREAVTRIRPMERFGSPAVVFLAECLLETGRTHQIRVHMAHAGLGLIGDPVYGGKGRASTAALGAEAAAACAQFPRQALHAAHLGFNHPATGEALHFESPLPDDMTGLLTQLRGTDRARMRSSH